jgi:hypothetical protein
MSDTSSYLGDALLNWIRNSGVILATKPTAVFAALYNGDPDAGGTEQTGLVAGLTRQPITLANPPAARAMSSTADITFGTAGGAGTVTYVAIYDSVTSGAGNQIAKHNISTTAIANGNVVKILSGNITLSY